MILRKSIIFLVSVISQVSFAATLNNDSIGWSINLDELIIISPKERKDFSLLPVSASMFSTGMIKSKDITGIKDISAMVPNLFMPDYGSRLTSPVYIRGIGSKINSPSVGLYIDNMPYFEKSAFDFDMMDIERIEVLRGPQGTLYGRNTMGGIIKIHTRSPLKYQGTNISIGTGSYLTSNIGFSHYKKLTDGLGLSVSAGYNHSDGHIKNVFNNSKADKINSFNSRLRLEWVVKPDVHLGVNSSLDYTNQNGYAYALFDTETGKTGDVNYNDEGLYKRIMSTTGISVGCKKEWYELTSQTSFQYLDDTQGIDQDFTPEPVYRASQFQTQYMLSEEINFKSRNELPYNWLFGAFGFWQDIDNTVILDYLSKNQFSEKFYNQPTFGGAFYHQSEFKDIAVDGLSVALGLRYDIEIANMDYSGNMRKLDNNKILSEFEPFYSEIVFSQLTPKVSVQYEFESTGQIYTTVSKGYKTGGFNTSFDTKDQSTFQPEYSWNYEIGAKHPFMEKRLIAELALFLIDWKNQQITQPLPSGKGSFLTNAGHSMSKGAEVTLMWNIFKGLTMNSSYGYTYAKFKDYENGEISYSGNYLPFVPKHTVNTGLNYSIVSPFKGVDRLSINIDYIGSGRIYWREDNVQSQRFYGLLNGKISVSKGIMTISAWGRNLTSTDYVSFYFESGGNKLAQKGKPFMAGVDMSLNF